MFGSRPRHHVGHHGDVMQPVVIRPVVLVHCLEFVLQRLDAFFGVPIEQALAVLDLVSHARGAIQPRHPLSALAGVGVMSGIVVGLHALPHHAREKPPTWRGLVTVTGPCPSGRLDEERGAQAASR